MKAFFPCMIAAAAMLVVACESTSDGGQISDITEVEPLSSPSSEPYSDLKVFELRGPVKECITDSYFDLEIKGDSIYPDTASINHRVVMASFDTMGNYITAENETVRRDNLGRIVSWQDCRPNFKNMHPGALKDTLSYDYINNNVLATNGMGEYAVAIYDNQGRVVGQYSDPSINGAHMSAFNIYRRQDEQGNWTERLTVWTSQAPGEKPHISYSLDRRKIKYYPQ